MAVDGPTQALGESTLLALKLWINEVYDAGSNLNIVEFAFLLSVRTDEEVFWMPYARFSFEKQFAKLVLKYVSYELFLGSAAAAGVSGTGREIPRDARARHVLKNLDLP